MSLPTLANQQMPSYRQMKRRSEQLTERFNVLISLQTSIAPLDGTPKFTFSSTNAKLALPDPTQLLADIEALKLL